MRLSSLILLLKEFDIRNVSTDKHALQKLKMKVVLYVYANVHVYDIR